MKPSIDLPNGRLRPLRESDADFTLFLLTRPEVRKYLCDDRTLTSPEVVAILSESTRLDAKELGLWVLENLQGESVGLVGLAPVSGPLETVPETAGEIEPTIALVPRHFGKGLAKDALSAAMRYARDALGLPGLVAAVDMPNKSSHHLLTACGFTECGTTPGTVHTLVIYKATFGELRRLDRPV